MTRSKVTLRPATAADIATFSSGPELPTVKAWIGEIDGRIVGFGGFALVNHRWIAFCELSEEGRCHKRAIVRAGRHVLGEARRAGHRFIYAKADSSEPMATRWLASLGFRPDAKTGLFRWQD